MQGLALQARFLAISAAQGLEPLPVAAAVEGVAQQRMALGGQVHPDLVGAAGLEPAFQQADPLPGEVLQGPVAGRRWLAAAHDHGHLLAVARAAADVAGDLAGRRPRLAPDQRQVAALDGPGRELLHQALVRLLGLGGDDQAAGVLVQAVHDAGPAHAADALQAVAAVGDQGVHQGAVRVAGRRVHDQARGFVDHDQVLVFMDDRQGNILSGQLDGFSLGHQDGESLAGFDPQRGLNYRLAARRQAAFLDQRLDPAAGQAGQAAGEQPVQALAGFLRLDGDFVPLGFAGLGHGTAGSPGRGRGGAGNRKRYRMQGLKALVIGMGVLILGGFVLVAVALVSRLTDGGESGFGASEVPVPDGCSVAETLAEGDRLLLRLEGPEARGCAQVVVVDLESGAVQGRLQLRPGPATE